MGNEIGVLIAQGLDVSNFVNDVSWLPKFVPRWGTTFNHFPREIGVPLAQILDVSNFLNDVPRVPKSVSE